MDFTESTRSTLFLLVELSIVIGSLGVVLLPKVIYSALLLGFVFIGVALLYLLLSADFLAAAQVLIYVGAVNVLIVFAVMLVSGSDISIKPKSKPPGETITALTLSGLFAFLITTVFTTSWNLPNIVQDGTTTKPLMNNVNTIGVQLLTNLVLPFELLSLLLLVALVGAITIARKEKPLT